MGFVLYISGCALSSIGALRALEERDIVPDALIARAGGALTGGLYACGWRADALERLAHTLQSSSLALLRQVLPALRGDAARLAPGDIAQHILDGEPDSDAFAQPAPAEDGLAALLSELTGTAELASLRMKLMLPARAYGGGKAVAAGYELRALTSGPDTQWALTLAMALRCAAFPADTVTSPNVSGRPLAACCAGDVMARSAVLRDYIGVRGLICISHPGEHPPAPAICIAVPQCSGRESTAAQIERGYMETRRHIDEIISFC